MTAYIKALQAEYEVPENTVFAWHKREDGLYDSLRREPWWSGTWDVRMQLMISGPAEFNDASTMSLLAYSGQYLVWSCPSLDCPIGQWLAMTVDSSAVNDAFLATYKRVPESLLTLIIVCEVDQSFSSLILNHLLNAGDVTCATRILQQCVAQTVYPNITIPTESRFWMAPLRDLQQVFAIFVETFSSGREWGSLEVEIPEDLTHEIAAIMSKHPIGLRYAHMDVCRLRRVRRMFALIVAVTAGHFRTREPRMTFKVFRPHFDPHFESEADDHQRFFAIAAQLPIELQWHLVCCQFRNRIAHKSLLAGDILWLANDVPDKWVFPDVEPVYPFDSDNEDSESELEGMDDLNDLVD
jgi:hypothetical protein